MCVSVVGRSRRSEHTLQFYCVALDLPFKTYLFSKSDINHMCLLDKYLNSCIYSSSTVCMLIKSSNRKTTMHFFFYLKVNFTAFCLLDLLYLNFHNYLTFSYFQDTLAYLSCGIYLPIYVTHGPDLLSYLFYVGAIGCFFNLTCLPP